ncbi:hypothetical protein F7725_003984 [Dissostichus mawsoni]|uniref:Uncharacterized protein n=1 Tax=Dissostichus mawsoni TaxID=36200 RepID=A0A7J5YBR2_DISMA|nr:hypothetical protein F7725_003984 [Dissostichus mawsoni]
MCCYPLGLLQLLGQLLQDGAVSLPHLLDLTLVVLRFLLDVFLQLRHFLLALLSSVSSSSVFSASSSSLRSRFSFSALFRAIFSDSRSSCSSLSEACISRTFFRALFFWLTSPLSSSLLSPTWSASAAARPPSSPADLSAPLAESGAQRSGPGSRWFPRPASSSPSPAPDGSSPPSSVSLNSRMSSSCFFILASVVTFSSCSFCRAASSSSSCSSSQMFTWMCDCIFFFSFTVLWLLSSSSSRRDSRSWRISSSSCFLEARRDLISSASANSSVSACSCSARIISPSTLLCFSFTFTSSSSFACISSSCRVSAADGLEVDDDVGDLQVPLLLQVSQHSGSEEDFTLTDPEEVQVELQGFDLPETGRDACFPSMKPLGMALGVRISYLDTEQGDTLCEDLRSHPLLVVGDDAADEVGVGVPQRGHELGQLLLVQLTHGPEHPLLGLIGGTERRLVHPRNWSRPTIRSTGEEENREETI